MKRIWLCMIAVLMVAVMAVIPVSAAGQNIITVVPSKTTVAPGEEFDVYVELTNNTGIAGFAANLTFDDTRFEFVSCVKEDTGIVSSKPAKIVDSVNFQYATTVNYTDSGTWITVTLRVKEDAPAGSAVFQFVPDSGTQFYYDEDDSEIDFAFDVTNGSVTVGGSSGESMKDFTENMYLVTDKTSYTYGDNVSVSVANLADGADVTYDVNGISCKTVQITEADTYVISATVSKEGYNTAVLDDITVIIEPKDISIVFEEDIEKVYDGTTNVTVNTEGAVLNGVLEGDDVGATFPGCKLPSANAGSYTLDLADTVLTGDDAKNYRLASVEEVTVTVTQRQLSYRVADVTKKLNEEDPEFTYTLQSGSLVSGHVMQTKLTRKTGEAVGTYEISASDTVVKDASGNDVTGNYFILFIGGSLKIEEAANPNAPTITVGNAKVMAGKTIDVTLEITNNTGLTGLTLNIENPEQFILRKVWQGAEKDEEDELVNPDAVEALMSLSMTPSSEITDSDGSTYYPDNLTVVWAAAAPNKKSGTILTLRFEIPEGTPADQYAIDVTVVEAIDGDAADVEIAVQDGVVEVIDFIYGDVSGDEKISVRDVVLLCRYIAGGYTFDENFCIEAGDVNLDGKYSVRDVVLICRFIAGGYGIVLGQKQ